MAKNVNREEYYLPLVVFKQVGGMRDRELEQLSRDYECCRAGEKGAPVFGTIRALCEERRLFCDATGANSASEVGVSHDILHEKLLQARISNQIKLGFLIPKEDAKNRMLSTFRKVAARVISSIKTAAPQIVGLTDLRDIEKRLTVEYNKAIKELEATATLLSWEDEGHTDLLKTKLMEIEMQDPDFVKLLKEKTYVESSDE